MTATMVQRTESFGAVTSTSKGTTVTGSGTANNKGSWVEMLASTSFVANGISVSITQATNLAVYLVDIGIGAAGSEQVIVPNLMCARKGSMAYHFPVRVPAGVRLAARVQSESPSGVAEVAGALYGGSDTGFQRVTAYGVNLASTTGTSVDAGATINTKGAYAQLVASTTNPIRHLIVATGNQDNFVLTDADYLVDLAIGAAASEQVIVSNMSVSANANADSFDGSIIIDAPFNIPAGTRLAARSQSSINDSNDRVMGLVAYGLD